jgi:TPR repeat protein
MDADSGQSPMVVIPVPPPPPAPPQPRLLVPIKKPEKDNNVWWYVAIGVAAVLLLLILLGFFFTYGPRMLGPRQLAALCPTPPTPAEASQQFNSQQREVRDLRRQSFRGDFFAQLALAHRYEGRRDSDKNLNDPVEAAVWYAMALANPEGYDRTSAAPRGDMFGPHQFVSRYDECRHAERDQAYRSLDKLLSQMSTEEQDKVRDRVTYVLSTQGAAGFRTLGRLHDQAYGPFGEPSDDLQGVPALRDWHNAVSLFERNGVDAYMFDYLAMQQGDEGAYVILQDLQASAPTPGFSDIAEQRARRWVPPFEFYPPDAPISGVPHTDESEPFQEIDRNALLRVNELPFEHVAQALVYLHVILSPCLEPELTPHDAQTFQAMLGRPLTDHLSPLEKVRAIQYAAISGSPKAQLVLAVMYAEGVGVAADYARAFHWFQEADRQGSLEAKFAVATYLSQGLAGVADQQKAEAVVKELDAALAGFKPSVRRLSALLDRVGGGHRGWSGYTRPEEEFYADDGDRFGYAGPGPQPPPQGDPPPSAIAPTSYVQPTPDPPPHAAAASSEDYSGAAGDTRPAHGRHLSYRATARVHQGSYGRTESLARAGRRLELAARTQESPSGASGASSSDQTQAASAAGSTH